MTIALVAHDSKKELMVQFCTAYRHILAQHHLIATGTTGRLVEENVGLPVQKFLPGGHGGDQQIMARIACEEVDMLLFFRDPISAKLVANLITTAGADRVLTMDLHAAQIQGFFDIPVDNLQGGLIFADHFLKRFGHGCEDLIVVSPDVGSVARSRTFSMKLGTGLAIVDKRREKANQSEVMNLIGDVRDKNVVILDDIVDTAGSLCGAAKAVKEIGGAKAVYACASHGVLSGPALERIAQSDLEELILLDTIPYPQGKPAVDKIHYLSVADVFAEAIERVYEDLSLASMFE